MPPRKKKAKVHGTKEDTCDPPAPPDVAVPDVGSEVTVTGPGHNGAMLLSAAKESQPEMQMTRSGGRPWTEGTPQDTDRWCRRNFFLKNAVPYIFEQFT